MFILLVPLFIAAVFVIGLATGIIGMALNYPYYDEPVDIVFLSFALFAVALLETVLGFVIYLAYNLF